jgi:hypothetical protein
MKLVQLFIKDYNFYAMFVSMLNFNRHSVLCSFIFSNTFYVHSCITRCLLERLPSFQVILMIFLNYHADDYDRSKNEAIKTTK